MQTIGDTISTAGTATFQSPDATDPATLNYASAATDNSDAGIFGGGIWRFGRNPLFQAFVRIQTTVAAMRTWIGYFDGGASLSSIISNDTPGTTYAAFRYSTSAGDTTWKCVTEQGGSRTISDSGITVDTTGREFEVDVTSGTRVVFRIDGAAVCTNTANLPSASVNARGVIYTRTLEAVAKNVRIGWLYNEGDR